MLGVACIGTVRTLLLAEQRSVIDDAAAVIQRMTAAGLPDFSANLCGS